YQAAFRVFAKIFKEGPFPTIHSLTAEEDRVVAEFRSRGILSNGDDYQNDYLFLFRVRDGRIAYVGEYFNPDVVRQKIAPAMAVARAGSKQVGGPRECAQPSSPPSTSSTPDRSIRIHTPTTSTCASTGRCGASRIRAW